MKMPLSIRSLLLLAVLFISLNAAAQQFIVDPKQGDNIPAEIGQADGEHPLVIKLPKDTLIVASRFDDTFAWVDINGAEYKVPMTALNFGPDNEGDAENPFSLGHRVRHSFIGDILGSGFMALLIAGLIIAAAVFGFIGTKSETTRQLALRAVPILLLAAALLEILVMQVMGSSALWWSKSGGFFAKLLISIPLALTVGAQYISFRLYSDLLFQGELDEEGEPKRLAMKPAAIALGAFIPVVIVVALVLTLIGLSDWLVELLTGVAAFGALYLGIRKTFNNNLKLMNRQSAILATAFTVIYLIGLLITGWIALKIILEMIIQIIMACVVVVGGFLLMGTAMSGGSGGGGGGSNNKYMYHDRRGGKHEFSADAERVDREIASKE